MSGALPSCLDFIRSHGRKILLNQQLGTGYCFCLLVIRSILVPWSRSTVACLALYNEELCMWLGTVLHAYNPGTRAAGAGKSQVQVHLKNREILSQKMKRIGNTAEGQRTGLACRKPQAQARPLPVTIKTYLYVVCFENTFSWPYLQ